MSEILIIMENNSTDEQMNKALAAVNDMGAKLMLRYPPSVLVCEYEGKSLSDIKSLEGVKNVYEKKVENPESFNLDTMGLLAVQAWNKRISGKFLENKAARPDEGKPWDFYERDVLDGLTHKKGDSALKSLRAGAGSPTAYNTSSYMTGTVAAGVIIVNGPNASDACFTSAEQINVFAEVQEAAAHLVNLSPASANLNFIFDINTVDISLDPNTVFEEEPWRDAALANFGYGPEFTGVYDYVHHLRTLKWPNMSAGPDWAYAAFFTKYATFHFGYAYIGGPYLVIQYDNNGWGPHQIDRVFAHETGHIFGGSDEYANCNSFVNYGYLDVPNGNCESINPNSVDCLMKGNTYDLCQYTRAHFGWRDSDSDGIPDPIDVPGTYSTDVGITPGNPHFNNTDVWIRNQDDGETNQNHQNIKSDRDNFIYCKVKNFGNVTAEIVRTNFYMANYTGTEFVFPNDYTNLIKAPDTPYPTVFSLSPGASEVTKVRLKESQIPPTSWHPCLLLHVSCQQDGVVPSGSNIWHSNNLAQKNLVIEYVGPSQKVTLPILLQNISAKQAHFEIKRIKGPKNLKVQLQFNDKRLNKRLVPKITHINDKLIDNIKLAITPPFSLAEENIRLKKDETTIKFLQNTNIEMNIPDLNQPLYAHIASGSFIGLKSQSFFEEDNHLDDTSIKAIEKADRVLLPIPISEIVRFNLPIKGEFRKTAGISFKVPDDALPGEEYQIDLVQYNENHKVTGGISFIIRVSDRAYIINQIHDRINILREVSLKTDLPQFDKLAQVSESLVKLYLEPLSPRSTDLLEARKTFACAVSNVASLDTLTYSSENLKELSLSLEKSQSFDDDLDILSDLLFYAQEYLLEEYIVSSES